MRQAAWKAAAPHPVDIAVTSLGFPGDEGQGAKQTCDNPDAKLMISLGRDVTGQAILAELNKMPHMLIAGSTGSGKSVCINGIIISLLLRTKPHEVKMMMISAIALNLR